MGREWFSPRGGLWFSIVLRPRLSPSEVPKLALMLGVVVVRVLSLEGLEYPLVHDPDGSRSDIGAYGGPQADEWDRDGDGAPDYFWPGTFEDAPEGVDTAAFDPDDTDPLVP